MAAPTCLPLTSLGTPSYDPLDANFFIWNFWSTKQALGYLQNPYWTPLPGLVAAFNGIALASFALTALGAYLLAVGLTRRRDAGLVCGLIVALMPFRFLNVARLSEGEWAGWGVARG